jgi:hypothetical protein
MNKAFFLLFCLASGPALGQSNPDHVTGIWYAKWGLALLPIAFGLIPHLLTLFVAAFLVRESVLKRPAKRMSGVPFVGPLFICLGLWWSPSQIPVWMYLIPWGLEIFAGIALVLVQKATHAKPA